MESSAARRLVFTFAIGASPLALLAAPTTLTVQNAQVTAGQSPVTMSFPVARKGTLATTCICAITLKTVRLFPEQTTPAQLASLRFLRGQRLAPFL